MLLKKLIKGISKDKKNIPVSGLAINSKQVKKKYIFFAIKGKKVNGENFIEEAIKNGASIIVCSKSCKFKSKSIVIVKTENIRSLLSEVSSKFYKLKPKNIIAVTGTNGKTSVADIFYQILRINKIPAASIGTLGIKYNNKIIKTSLTSPDTIALHKNLHFLKKKKIDNVIIEASSHGLDQKRLNNINFKAGIFTNFSQDHLDYHRTMKSYLNAKLILLRKILKRSSSIITDKHIKPFKKIKTIAHKRNLKLIDVSKNYEDIQNLSSNFTNDFKLKNLAMSIEALKLCGIKKKLIFKSIRKIKDVNGRLELVRELPNDIKIFVDYAHTPDALSETLKSLNKTYGNNIILVFGCGGDRDKKKRKFMAKIANDYCKKIYLTDDNPRNENPSKIRTHLAKYILKNKRFNIGDRSLAIKKAIQNAGPREIVVIAGKGHEEEQIYKNRVNLISDKEIVKKLYFKNKILSKKRQEYFKNKLILEKIFGKKLSLNIDGLSIDTRTIKKDNIFIAIRGKTKDGNAFIKNAFSRGAGAVVSSSTLKRYEKKIIKLEKPSSFLNKFAKLKREQSLAKIIAITGSAGKTSLKNLLKDILKNFGKTHFSPKSFNNHFGVPISLSNLSTDTKFGIFEVGMSKAGEIKNLSKLIKPHIGIITNIGEAHLENFKNIFGIAKAKSEIIENIVPGGTIILNRDDKFFHFLYNKAKIYKLKIFTFGKHKKSDIRLKRLKNKNQISEIFLKIKNKIINFKIKDLNIYNVLASIAVLNELGINPLNIIRKFKDFEMSEGRGKKHLITRYNKRFKLIDESYNASPLSVKNAIKNLSLIKKEKFKKYLLLGDMLELGDKSNKYHKEISKVINNSDIDKVFIKGKKTIFTYKYLNKQKRGNILQNNEDIDFSLSKMISNNDYLLIKGSHATGLNNFSKKIIRGI